MSRTHTEPYRITTEEVQQSMQWLENEHDGDNSFIATRSEVKETRFKGSDVPTIEDKDILRKFHEAQALPESSSTH